MDDELRVALLGTRGGVREEPGNVLLDPTQFPLEHDDVSYISPRESNVFGRHVTVFNMLDLHDTELYLDLNGRQFGDMLTELKIHAFLIVLPLDQLTDDDKSGAQWLLASLMARVKALDFAMILFTYDEGENCDSVVDDLKKNIVLEQMVEKCGGRYHTCNKRMNIQSEMKALLEKIDNLVSENEKKSFTAETSMSTVSLFQQGLNVNENENDVTEDGNETSANPHPDRQWRRAAVHSSVAAEKTKAPRLERHVISPDPSPGRERQRQEEQDDLSEPSESKSEVNDQKEKELDMDRELQDLLHILDLKDRQHKLSTSDFLTIGQKSHNVPKANQSLVFILLSKLFTLDYRGRYISCREEISEQSFKKLKGNATENEGSLYDTLFSKMGGTNDGASSQTQVHPMDVQMAVFQCADRFLQQYMVTKLSQCQYALPLLAPNPFTQEVEALLWTFRQIKKTWKSTDKSGKIRSKTYPIYDVKTPMVAFFRIGSVSSSKSQLMNGLINERHNTFFHRHCQGSSKTRLLMDGVVEIAWYSPSGKATDNFPDCVAFCNLHGDAGTIEMQRQILTKMASVVVVLFRDLNRTDKNLDIVQGLFKSPTHVIFLLTEDDSALKTIGQEKYKMGLRDRNQSDVSADLREVIKVSLSKWSQTFMLEDVTKFPGVRVDEDDEDCKTGRMAALQMIKLLQEEDLFTVKEKYLPCQGKVWHDWCQKNKELRRLQGNNLETKKCDIQQRMRQNRCQQQKNGFSELMKLFSNSLSSLDVDEKMYFLKWTGIMLDKLTSETLSNLYHEYDKEWSKVLELKKKHDKSEDLATAQRRLEGTSDKLNAATFGLEHILREMGQIYEAWASQKGREKDDKSVLPKLAAELMISGYPMEIMDGDAGHVPVIWVKAVLDSVIQKLGNQKVFVLSILGIQSTGKSTMLNAIFGLQFAVSAGRCTRGAFVQLVRVADDMKAKLKLDYLLVVDTEGLRALELTGKSANHHDNELATFVVGLGNMTLINIFGENPAEMQDILQIVVQAFLRMKNIKLSPSCVFVHQNVGDITAGEKNMEGRRRLQDKLDEMTQLAAKEEVCDAECFSDVIAFDVQRDVKYFAQLWEGSPPMAPPNPCYSENVQELKETILCQASRTNCMELSHFKKRLQDLWDALLSEDFVFSFRNTREIAVYRKLEEEYGRWTWCLRSVMHTIEDKLHNRILNKKLTIVGENILMDEMRKTIEEVTKSVKLYFEESKEKDILIQWKGRFEEKIKEVCGDLLKRAKNKLENIIALREVRKTLDEKKTLYDSKLLEKSKELATNLKHKTNNENTLRQEFDSVWSVWVWELIKDAKPFTVPDIAMDVTNILSETYERSLVQDRRKCGAFSKIISISNYSSYVKMTHTFNIFSKPHLSSQDQNSIRNLTLDITGKGMRLVESVPVSAKGYDVKCIQQIIDLVKSAVKDHETQTSKYAFKKEFTVDLSLHVCEQADGILSQQHQLFRMENDPHIYLEKKKPEFQEVFKKYCQGAQSAVIFGGLICSELREPILRSVYHKTARDLAGEMRSNSPALNGNRSNLEKHMLRSLADEENFEKFMTYIHNPRGNLENFIKGELNNYIKLDNPKALALIKVHLTQSQTCVVSAAAEATVKVKTEQGNVNMWLRSFSDSLADELEYNKQHLTSAQDITDFDLMEKVLSEDLKSMIKQLSCGFKSLSDLQMEMFRERPDEILIKHFCQCCWVQCPFCNALCTNTLEGHSGDHSVPFHRNGAVKGRCFKGTTHLSPNFCTTLVASNWVFYPASDPDNEIPWNKYRTGGPKYAAWSITPDLSELPYWKWFVCRFEGDLEKYYKKTFDGQGEIPSEWRNYTKEQAIESLNKMI